MKKKYHQHGQTLIETLATILFIAIGIIALIRFQHYLTYANSRDQQRADAAALAEKQIESLRDYQVINNTTGYNSYNSIASGTSNFTGQNTAFAITWTVTPYTNPTYKVIDVQVNWNDIRGTAQSVRLITEVASIDPSAAASVM